MNVVKKDIEDKAFIDYILTHYKKHGRHDLIWRKNINAYRIIVSEIMLQQTQVSRVLPKFEQWMKQYPTLKILKTAQFKDILVLWQGLGYQRRAKALYELAQSYASVPKTYEKLLDVRGVGSYTASAVCAFAYDTFTHPVLETNIRTALIEEFHQGEEEIHDGLLYEDLERLVKYPKVQKVGARTWYYALMDYGAYLKQQNISHNKKSAHHVTQTPYKGSTRELRAKVLFALTHGEKLRGDARELEVLQSLQKEGYIEKRRTRYVIKN